MNRRGILVEDSKGVSPVIGVMLMIVVTIILAAAVSSYSGGLFKSSTIAPTATFEVEIAKDVTESMEGWENTKSYMWIKEITGDTIETKNLKIMTVNPKARGNTTIMEILPNSNNTYYTSSGSWTEPDTGEVFTWDDEYEGTSPYWGNPAHGYFGNNPAVDFGNYTLKPGVIMIADVYDNYEGAEYWDEDEGDYEGDYRTGMEVCFADWESIEKGDIVTVKIVHIPSQKVIFQTGVEVM